MLTRATAAAVGDDSGRTGCLLITDDGRSLFGDLRHDRPWRSRRQRCLAVAAGLCRQGCRDRLAAIRKLLATGKEGLQKESAEGIDRTRRDARRARQDLAKDAPELISAMLAGGYDQAAARWIPAVNGMDDADSDRCWAMLALARA